MTSNIKITGAQYSLLDENAIDKSFQTIGFNFVIGKEVVLYKTYDDNHDIVNEYTMTGNEIIYRIVPLSGDSRVFVKISKTINPNSSLGWIIIERALKK
jgi:hypothetical protein